MHRYLGSFALSGVTLSRGTLKAIATLIASAIDRVRAIELLTKVEAVRESGRLKSALLDAIAHDFKTPLTSIKAAATSLLEDLRFNKRHRGELLIVIGEECDRINRVIGQAIEMAQLDAGEVKLQPGTYRVTDLLDAAIKDCESIQKMRTIRTELQQPDTHVRCDMTWARKVIDHLIQNADLFSPPGEPITLTTQENEGFVVFQVADVGPGIENEELEQIFGFFVARPSGTACPEPVWDSHLRKRSWKRTAVRLRPPVKWATVPSSLLACRLIDQKGRCAHPNRRSSRSPTQRANSKWSTA